MGEGKKWDTKQAEGRKADEEGETRESLGVKWWWDAGESSHLWKREAEQKTSDHGREGNQKKGRGTVG